MENNTKDELIEAISSNVAITTHAIFDEIEEDQRLSFSGSDSYRPPTKDTVGLLLKSLLISIDPKYKIILSDLCFDLTVKYLILNEDNPKAIDDFSEIVKIEENKLKLEDWQGKNLVKIQKIYQDKKTKRYIKLIHNIEKKTQAFLGAGEICETSLLLCSGKRIWGSV